MKIVAIMGSPRGMKGNTGALLAGVIQGCKAAGADVKTLSLAKLKVGPCVGCEVCHRTGKCFIKDDFERVKKEMLAADAIVMASPNYINSVTAQMKALFDRCSSPIHCQSFEGHYGAAVVTSGGPGGEEVGEYILRFLRSIGCWSVGSVGAEARHLVDEKMRPKALAAAAALGRKLCEAVRDGETYPEQRQALEGFRERMKMLVTTHEKDWPYEYGFWKSMGRL